MSISRRVFLKGAAAGGAAAAFGLSAAAPAAAAAVDPAKAIIIYYSRTGSTEAIAEVIAKETGARVLRIDVKDPYAASYGDMTDIARSEVRRKARRELSTTIPDLSGFDVVFLGSPYWWGSLSVPMATFLMDNNLAGKRVYPFITSGSSSPAGALSRIRELCPKAEVGEYFYVPGSQASGAADDVKAWLKKINQ